MLVKFKKVIAILIDEHSMVSMRMLGSACSNVNECAHGGNHSDEDWGGVPIVTLVMIFNCHHHLIRVVLMYYIMVVAIMVFLALKLLVQSSSSTAQI
jgi:hypothetical protein